MCNDTVRRQTYTLCYVPNHFKTQKICKKAVEKDPCSLADVPDHFKTQDI